MPIKCEDTPWFEDSDANVKQQLAGMLCADMGDTHVTLQNVINSTWIDDGQSFYFAVDTCENF